MGIHHDYAFVSHKALKDAGYFSDEILSEMDMTKNEMVDFLKKHGTMGLADRYPNTRTGSINLLNVFLGEDLGEDLTENQMKVSLTAMLKANADHDGDSYSMAFLQNIKDGKIMNGTKFFKAREQAYEAIQQREGISRSDVTYDMLLEQVKKDGFISEEQFNEYNNMQASLSITAAKDNQR